LRPDLTEESAQEIVGKLRKLVVQEGGKVLRINPLGKRSLAFPIAKQEKGVFFELGFLGRGRVVAELERNMRILEVVLRYQTLRRADEVDPDAATLMGDDEPAPTLLATMKEPVRAAGDEEGFGPEEEEEWRSFPDERVERERHKKTAAVAAASAAVPSAAGEPVVASKG